MIRKLEIDNFKTLNHFTMDFSPMTVIVGNNASGKSTILQVLSLLSSCVQQDFGTFFYGFLLWSVLFPAQEAPSRT